MVNVGWHPSDPGPRRESEMGANSDQSSDLSSLNGSIRQLEEQLERMVSANEALRQDLEAERSRRLGLEGQRDQLQDKLRLAESEDADRENLQGELDYLNRERARLAATVRQLTQRVSAEEEQRDKQVRALEQLRAARDESLEEILAVESQFDRALAVVTHLQAQLASALDERDTLAARLRAARVQLDELREERDALVAEVEQSKAALDEIRRSLVEAFDGGSPEGGRSREPRGRGGGGA